jgi:hypothetical protein
MAVNQVPGVSEPRPVVAPQPIGVSAQLAEARAQLKSAAPENSWDGVLAEVRRLQADSGMPMLQALHAVYRKLANGWVPS